MATPEPSIANYDESLILDSVDRFLERDVRPHVRELEENDIWPEEIVEKMKELGLFGATIGEEYGGLGLSASIYSRIVERVSAVWMSVSGHLQLALSSWPPSSSASVPRPRSGATFHGVRTASCAARSR